MAVLVKRVRRLAICGFLAAAVLIARDALPQVFAPGKLSRSHSPWRSLSKCDTCHSTNNRVDRGKCLSCHEPVAARIRARKGFHGRASVRKAPCESCHKEHRGEERSLIRWPEGDEKSFDHTTTGWPLKGAHRKSRCEACHDPRRIVAPEVRSYLKAHPESKTYQGLPTACRACHFDEHRGALGDRCERCHDETDFKRAPKFTHDAVWPLVGAHRRVTCARCHSLQSDPRYDKAGFPRARAAAYLKMSPVAHARCTDCHTDPHNDRFGSDCLACHTQERWELDEPPRDLAFHDRTAFPLEGRHRFVPCKRCHRKNKQGRMHLKPIPHGRCAGCHPNAHPDISEKEMSRRDCAACHDNDGFKPSRFTAADHRNTGFPLKGAHTATACPACHLKKLGPPPTDRGARRTPKHLAARVRSPWRLRAGVTPDRCPRCHASPHRKQFNDRPCTECHDGRSWSIPADRFDHNRTRYPLTGKHRQVRCPDCHKSVSDKDGTFVRYRPLPFSDCTPCHRDVHYGQFSELTPERRCRACHDTAGFVPARFDHNDPRKSGFPLKGTHATLGCERCHPKTTLAEGVRVTRYRPTMKECGGCHEDVHDGAYRLAVDLLKRAGSRSPSSGTAAAPKARDPWSIPASWYRLKPDDRTDCASCHSEEGWRAVSFDHTRTRFPLKGRHRKVSCERCHKGGVRRPLPRRCAGCHEDVHRGALGSRCGECHTEAGFDRVEKVYARHNRTTFPLTGRHAALPCTECHRDANRREFNRTPNRCEDCHTEDIPSAGEAAVDHGPLRSACDRCHTPVDWKVAAFQGHDRCFPISTVSRHGAVRCRKCHQGAPPAALGDCTTGTFSCRQCHGCEAARHRGVSGYRCEDRGCYSCHRNP